MDVGELGPVHVCCGAYPGHRDDCTASDMTETAGPASLGDQFAAFADETAEWAELDLVAGLEGWPDDDWTDI